MNKAYVDGAKGEIRQWESQGPGFMNHLTDFMFFPAGNLARALIPARIQRAVGKATYDLLSRLGSATELLIDQERIYQRVDAGYRKHGDELRAADSAARRYRRKSIAYAAGEGSAAGALGFVGLAADIPALLTISMRLIRQIGTCYSYEMSSEEETEHALHVLRLGASSTMKAKVESLAGLKQVQRILVRLSVTSAAERLATSQLGRLSVLAGLRQFAEKIGVQITARKALELVPVVGAVIGGSCNAMFVNDVGRAAYMAFRRRRIVEMETPEAAALALL